jgi:hypothetical protein
MPNVTSRPGASWTRSAAAAIAVWNASSGEITWSDGSTTIVASGSRAKSNSAASPIAGAVSRRQGSATICSWASCGSCSAIGAASARLVMTHVRSGGTSVPSRAAVAWIMVRPPVKSRSCLGRAARLSGQNRVPDPPAMMTA